MSLLEKLRADIQEALDERAEEQTKLDEARSKMDEVTASAEARGDGVLTDDETKALTEAREVAKAARDKLKELDEQRGDMEQRVEDIKASEEARQAALKSAEKYGGTEKVQVKSEPEIYSRESGHSFFRDAFFRGSDPLAADRILRHAQSVEARDASTTSFAGLVVPQYLVEDFASIAHAGRPFANAQNKRPLPPDGMVFTVPKGATGTLVVSQTSENSAVGEQDYDVDNITVNVVTIAGQQDISRQALDRGSGVDEVVMQDLAETYTAELDRQLINGSGANGQHLGILSTTNVGTVTVTASAAVTQVRVVADAVQRVQSTRFLSPTHIFVHPRRWGYWVQAVDSNNRPLVTPRGHGPQNAFGVGDLVDVEQVVGDLYGIPVIADPNIPTTLSYDVTQSSTTDPIIVTRSTDNYLWEDNPLPMRVRFDETIAGSLTIKVVAWDYSGWTAGRYPTATRVLAGSGLTTPTFG